MLLISLLPNFFLLLNCRFFIPIDSNSLTSPHLYHILQFSYGILSMKWHYFWWDAVSGTLFLLFCSPSTWLGTFVLFPTHDYCMMRLWSSRESPMNSYTHYRQMNFTMRSTWSEILHQMLAYLFMSKELIFNTLKDTKWKTVPLLFFVGGILMQW